MTTTSYRVRAAVGVRHLFSVEALLCCPVASWCTRNDDNDILPRPRGGGCSSPFPSRHYSAVRSRLVARGTMTTTSYRGRAAVGVRILFFVEALPCCPVASWCTRNDDNDILPQDTTTYRRWVFVTFSSRHYSAVRSRLGACGTMTTTSYRVRAAVGVRHLFPSRHYSAVRSCVVARGTMTTTSYRGRAAVGVRTFFVEALLCCPVASWCTRNDDNDILPRTRSGGVRHLFSVEALLCCPVASWCTRNDDNDILPRTRGGGCSYPFFRRGTTLLSGRVLVHAER
ncbi:uncharacterized protein TNCV_4588021 [Trichonephila clavipes]|uniref:Uncharacterized protein n=1 Tax=Trichonephila clavipes TaxID=2585209 RepID=A0A8X6S753_TRICX|nr:uncharacterized protein TNCV_4588021 [Trichonephila clavipes]